MLRDAYQDVPHVSRSKYHVEVKDEFGGARLLFLV